MLDLRRYFISPFHDEDISLEELLSYSTVHLAEMTANNPGGILNTNITATNTLLLALGGSVSSEQGQLGIQLARTQVKGDFRTSLPNELSKLKCIADRKINLRANFTAP